jgi:tRNA(Ile)-lysidine synthase
MQKISKRNQLTLIRPWIEVSKELIVNFLNDNQLPFFIDPTNNDQKFLRANMRSSLIPQIESHFGKSIAEPLLRISRECHELNAWMETKWTSLIHADFLDCHEIESSFERKWVIRAWLSRLKIECSYVSINTMADLIEQNKADRCIDTKHYHLQVDRKRVFAIIKQKFNLDPIDIGLGQFKWGPWKVVVKQAACSVAIKRGWLAAIKGEIISEIAPGPWKIGLCQDLLEKDVKTRLQKKWSGSKIPAFLTSWVPVIAYNGQLEQEFLIQPASPLKAPGNWQLILLYDESCLW